jgi:hypothetical protein
MFTTEQSCVIWCYLYYDYDILLIFQFAICDIYWFSSILNVLEIISHSVIINIFNSIQQAKFVLLKPQMLCCSLF